MGNVTYESICEKLGLDVDTYQPPMQIQKMLMEKVHLENLYLKIEFFY